MKSDDAVTVREFLTKIRIQEILAATENKYEMYSELFLAFMKCFRELTRTQSSVTPKYFIRYMYCIPRDVKIENIFTEMVNYYSLVSVKFGRTFNIDKTRVKSIEDFVNAKVELVEESGEGGLSYAEQAVIMLLNFCVLDEDVIAAYADGEDKLSAAQLMWMIRL